MTASTDHDATLTDRLAALDAERAAIIDEDGAPSTSRADQDAATDSAPARQEDVWPFEFMELYEEKWEVRVPSPQALTAVALSAGKFVPQRLQSDVVSLFLRNHMSEASFSRMFERLTDPDDPDFEVGTLGVIMRALSDKTTARMKEGQGK